MPGPAAQNKPIPRALRRGVYPGSFNPPTIGHVAIAEAAIEQRQLDQLHIVVSRAALAKPNPSGPDIQRRLEVISASFAHLTNVVVDATDHQLIADIAHDFDVVVMGLDKWRQINDVTFYDDDHHMAAALARLPELAIAGRDGHRAPIHAALQVAASIDSVSSSSARASRPDWMTPEAAASLHW